MGPFGARTRQGRGSGLGRLPSRGSGLGRGSLSLWSDVFFQGFQSCSGSSNGGTKLFGHLLCMLDRGDWRQARGARKMGVTVTAVTVIIQVS